MITDQRYCVDILIQLKASTSAIQSIESEVFEKHFKGCIKEAMASKDQADVDNKIDEVMNLFLKRLKS